MGERGEAAHGARPVYTPQGRDSLGKNPPGHSSGYLRGQAINRT